MREAARFIRQCDQSAAVLGVVHLSRGEWARIKKALATGVAQAHLSVRFDEDPDALAGSYDQARERHEAAVRRFWEDPHGHA